MLLLLLLFLLCAGQIMGRDGPPRCEHKYKYLQNKRGHLMGHFQVEDPCGPVNMSVVIAFRMSLSDRQVELGGMRMKERNAGKTPMLHYYIRFPVQRPKPKIMQITFNNQVICISKVSQHEKSFVTSFAHTLNGNKMKKGCSHSNVGSGFSSTVDSVDPDDWHLAPEMAVSSTNVFPEVPPAGVRPTRRPSPGPSRPPQGTISQPTTTKPAEIEGPMKEYCGLSVRPQTLMLGGRDVENGDWPWVVLLFEATTNELYCAGVLVSKRFVVIAAHCLIDPVKKTKVEEETLILIMGKFDFSKWVERDMQPREVRRIILHPDFQEDSLTNDIALLYLEDDVDYTMYARPICLWEDDVSIESLVDQVGTVVGWNSDEDLPRRALVPIVSHQQCLAFAGQAADHRFCAGNVTGSKHCIGDADGGLFLSKVGGDGNLRWFLRGIPSSHLQRDLETCKRGGYVVYTDAAAYTAWIREVVKTTKPYHD